VINGNYCRPHECTLADVLGEPGAKYDMIALAGFSLARYRENLIGADT
jgi:hypothetical protein